MSDFLRELAGRALSGALAPRLHCAKAMMTTPSVTTVEQHARATLLRPYDRRVRRYWDRRQHRMTVELMPGQRYLSSRNELLRTVVGAGCCVCFRHRVSGIAGMASLLVSADVEPLLCIEHCLLSLDDLTNRIVDASGGRQPSELDVWFVIGGDVGTLDVEDREFQLGVISSILCGYGSPVVQTQRGCRKPLIVRFDAREGRLTATELRHFSSIGLKRDFEWLARSHAINEHRLQVESGGRFDDIQASTCEPQKTPANRR